MSAASERLVTIALLGFSVLVVPKGPGWGAFLDFSPAAREAGIGGNAVACPDGTSALSNDPAGLAGADRDRISARYENLFSGIEGDDLSTGNISAVLPLDPEEAMGFSLDHFTADALQQDRVKAAFGKAFGPGTALEHLRLGIDLSFLRQQFTLAAPLAGVSAGQVTAQAFSIGAGALFDPWRWCTLGVSGEDLNRPNLGVIGVDRVDPILRYGAAIRPPFGTDPLEITLAQSLDGDHWETQGGIEWTWVRWNLSLRAGGDSRTGALGFGWTDEGLSLDYAYQFSWGGSPSVSGVGVPGSHLLEVAFAWDTGNRENQVWADLMDRAKKASAESKWKDAFWDYQQACLLRPQDSTALSGRSEALRRYNQQRAQVFFQRGRKAEEQGYFREAEQDYEWAATLDPGQGDYVRAKEQVTKALKQGALSDPRVRDLLERSVQLIKKRDRAGANRNLRKALALYPKDAFLQFVARAYSPSTEKGTPALDRSLERMSVEAEIYRSKGRLDLARETWRSMLGKDPSNALARDNLAATEERPQTLTEDQKARAQALLQRGLKAYAAGDSVEAQRYWEEVLKIDPLNLNALNNLARVKMEDKR
ncbi:MAG TPA: hypothetical protein VHE12_09185 [bacterium]|nr:hypothetical protein [bacterium]